jgi:glucose dehydrogenase
VGQWYQASTVAAIPTEPTTGAILGVVPGTAEIKWKFEMVTPPSSGLLSTAGNLVFAGDREGYVFALDARTGKVLWKFQAGGTVIAPPITYLLDGRQYVAVAAGSSMLTFALPKSAAAPAAKPAAAAK